MLRGRKDIDAVFKDGLANHELEPGAYVWESIEKNLAQQQKQKRMLVIWRSVAAASVLLLVSLSISLYYTEVIPFEAEVASIQENEISDKATLEKEEVSLTKSVDKDHLSSGQGASPELIPAVPKEKSTKKQVQKKYQRYDSYAYANNVEKMNYLAANNDIDIREEYFINTSLHQKEEKVYFPIYATTNEVSKKRTSLSIGGVVSPAYNSKMNTGGGSPVMASSNVKVNENGINSMGGGVQLRLSTGSRWSFDTGVLYAQVGQEVSNTNSYQPFRSVIGSADELSNAGVANSMGTIIVKNPSPMSDAQSGKANLIEASNGYASLSSMSSVKQTLDYLEVPMMARYSLIKNFPYLSLAGGISSNFLVNNTAYALDGEEQEKIGETSDIKPFVLSSSVGLGLELPVFKSLRLNLEPRFKYFLNSVSSNDDFNFQPYSFGIYGGVTFVIR
ncbi:outer membrane beta-barrel protein [Carboxylicivirga marina]|uniref:PorT family protein n=1 Tax=Carboxylicivirga marina TaxID=2800988 RepID=A0ABS1HDS7_9BACT|nr:outer membrane beta-barrel protein [Carboxylicivirga marina]MBK3515822.1 PorT family protein [Carboxylicivirga marina]